MLGENHVILSHQDQDYAYIQYDGTNFNLKYNNNSNPWWCVVIDEQFLDRAQVQKIDGYKVDLLDYLAERMAEKIQLTKY